MPPAIDADSTPPNADISTRELPRPELGQPLDLVIGTNAARHRLSRRRITLLGSRADCEVCIDDETVSAHHAALRWRDGYYLVEDLGSTNGTVVDGVAVHRARVDAGSRICLGRVSIQLVARGKAEAPVALPPSPIVGSSRVLRSSLETLHKYAPLPLPVLLRGETGTGKELFATTLHRWSPRAAGPFIAVNCAAIPSELAESELFGHVKGAFTGAHRDHEGAFVSASGGALFLDEIGELPLALQAKLLRVLETKRVRPVGREDERPVDVRIVAATHRDLETMVEQRLLREDLYHRIGVLVLNLPPLRSRRDDIPVLLRHFAQSVALELGRPVEITQAAIEAARQAPWPGNVRALRNAVLRAAALSPDTIDGASLLAAHRPGPSASIDGLIEVPRGSYAEMQRALVARVVAEEGSIRRASAVLGVPRSTLGAWLRRS